MGIPITPPNLGDDCASCFAAGNTPAEIFASTMDIETGDNWGPLDPPPPNNIYKLQQSIVTPCRFSALHAPFFFEFFFAGAVQTLEITFLGEINPFFHRGRQIPCQVHMNNQTILPAGRHYYGGHAQIGWIPVTPSPSLTDIANSVGLTVDDEVNSDFWPIDNDYTTRLVSHKVPTNVLIRREN